MTSWRERGARDYTPAPTPQEPRGRAAIAGVLVLCLLAGAWWWLAPGGDASSADALVREINRVNVSALDQAGVDKAWRRAKRARRAVNAAKIELKKTKSRRALFKQIADFEARLRARAKGLSAERKAK